MGNWYADMEVAVAVPVGEAVGVPETEEEEPEPPRSLQFGTFVSSAPERLIYSKGNSPTAGPSSGLRIVLGMFGEDASRNSPNSSCRYNGGSHSDPHLQLPPPVRLATRGRSFLPPARPVSSHCKERPGVRLALCACVLVWHAASIGSCTVRLHGDRICGTVEVILQ